MLTKIIQLNRNKLANPNLESYYYIIKFLTTNFFQISVLLEFMEREYSDEEADKVRDQTAEIYTSFRDSPYYREMRPIKRRVSTVKMAAANYSAKLMP